MMRLYVISGIVLVLAVLLFGCLSQETRQGEDGGTVKAVIFKSASCGCCGEYAGYLRAKGFDVEVRTTEDMASVKRQYGIPRGMESCHTTMIGDYFVEGHVPVEAIDMLLLEKPQIDGIALPEMPSGSPGMPGRQTAPFVIYSLDGGKSAEFTRVG